MTKVLGPMTDVFGVLDKLDRLLVKYMCMGVGGHLLVGSWEVMSFLISGLDVFERHLNDVCVNVK